MSIQHYVAANANPVRPDEATHYRHLVTYADHVAAVAEAEQRVLKDTATRHLALIKMIGLGILQTRADELRACEERIAGQLKEQRSEDSKWSYAKGFDDARWISAKEALQGVLHEEPCDCEPCKAITRALAELWTIGQD